MFDSGIEGPRFKPQPELFEKIISNAILTERYVTINLSTTLTVLKYHCD